MNTSDINGLIDKVYDCSIESLEELIGDLEDILACRKEEE